MKTLLRKKPDAFYHRYIYDAENRITNVETSTDSIYWENEAFYSYYLHGPLARAEIGELEVQGTDYAYTLQGWLKGINTSNASGGSFDMGTDGSQTFKSANDAFGYTLYYFNDDYKPIAQNRIPFAAVNNTILPAFKPLYNGNIAAISEDLTSFKPILFAYGYDQLNRLVQMRTYKNTDGSFSATSNVWNPIAIKDYNEDITYDANGNIVKYKRYGNSTNQSQTNAKVMDSLLYKYEPNSNRLDWIKDSVGNAVFANDINSQNPDNYGYDAIGNLKRDDKENIDSILWTVYGKIEKIYKHDGTVISYSYDAAGNRISKIVSGASGGNGETWYVHDASGNTLSVYVVNDTNVNGGALTLSEQNLYGSSRLGVYKPALNLSAYTPPDTILMTGLSSGGYIHDFIRGQKFYELNNHLGNVMVTISDKSVSVDNDNDGVINYYLPDIVSAQSYYPGGMIMPGRIYTASSSNYRYGFNGKEKVSEIYGESNFYDYGMRGYDPRVGRFWSVDPLTKKYPELTPFQFSSDNPIWNIDLDGLEGTHYTDPKQMLYEAGGDISEAMANVADKFSAKLEAGYTFFKQLFSKGNTTVSAERTTTFSAGFTPNTKSFINYVKATNTSQGAPPLFNIELEKTTSTAAVTKVKMGNVTQTYTLSQDSKGVFKADASVNYATFLWGIPADITGSVSKKSTDEKSISGGFTLKATDNIKFPFKVDFTQAPNGTKKVNEKVGGEIKIGDKSGIKIFTNANASVSF